MSTLVSSVLQDVATYINQDPTLPTGTDETMWIDLVDQSQREWGNAYIWRKVLTTQYTPATSQSQVSIGLPTNFNRMLSPLYDYSISPSNPAVYYEIQPADRGYKLSTDKYVVKYGNDANGKYLFVNPGLPSGASICFNYLATPSSLVTLTDTVTCQDPQFLVLRTISKILSSRSDPRFPAVKADSDAVLGSMMDNEAAPTGGMNNQMRSTLEKQGFRVGES